MGSCSEDWILIALIIFLVCFCFWLHRELMRSSKENLDLKSARFEAEKYKAILKLNGWEK